MANPLELFNRAVHLHQTGKIAEAIDAYQSLNERHPDHPQVLYMLGTAEAQRGNYARSLELLGRSIEISPDIPELRNNLGIVLKELRRFDEALESWGHALRLRPDYTEVYVNRGVAFSALRRPDEALQSYERALQLNPDHPEALNNRGIILRERERFDEALQSYDRAIRQDPGYAEVYYNRGIVLLELGRHGESLESFDRALHLVPGYPEAHFNRGLVLLKLGRLEEALIDFGCAIKARPGYPEVHYHLGNALHDLKRFEEALPRYDAAIALRPDYPEAHFFRGSTLEGLRRFHEALQGYDQALRLNPDYPEAHFNRGFVLKHLKRFDEAIQSFERAIKLKPDNDYWLGNLIHEKLGCCDWNDFETYRKRFLESIISGKKSGSPFVTLLVSDSSDMQLRSAAILAADITAAAPSSVPGRYPEHAKLRLGYFSANFHDHAVMHLMAELFEKHDRSAYELYGFSFGPQSDDPWRKRVESCFSRFFDIRFMADREVGSLARDLEIDIAVDLMGYTRDSRPNIFALRAAPVQVNYLGYPGTMGGEFIDYIIADATVIPESDRDNYAEKVVCLPGCYQANCRNRDVAHRPVTREELHLPQDGFVFCCFNKSNKINPAVFDSWMCILKQVDKSVLWLLESNRWAVESLRREAGDRGVSPHRLVFAEKLPIEDHLNRIRHADLFLDTFPYNAHTTASDALRMGVPLLTYAGNGFAGRVAASLLKTLGMDELITVSLVAYEERAVELAANRGLLAGMRAKLHENIKTSPLFDSGLLTRNMERAFDAMHERSRKGLKPDHMIIGR